MTALARPAHVQLSSPPPLINPYWDQVLPCIGPSAFGWGPPVARRWDWDFNPDHKNTDRRDLVHAFSWTITDPWAVHFVATYARGRLIDPMAGTGYWAFLLAQLGVDTVCFDDKPGADNFWHGNAYRWVPIAPGDAAKTVVAHSDRVLLLAWPPYSDPAGYRALRAYRGDRVIYLGEHDGCTGDEALRRELDRNWAIEARREPIQWEGMHDDITVYRRLS